METVVDYAGKMARIDTPLGTLSIRIIENEAVCTLQGDYDRAHVDDVLATLTFECATAITQLLLDTALVGHLANAFRMYQNAGTAAVQMRSLYQAQSLPSQELTNIYDFLLRQCRETENVIDTYLHTLPGTSRLHVRVLLCTALVLAAGHAQQKAA